MRRAIVFAIGLLTHVVVADDEPWQYSHADDRIKFDPEMITLGRSDNAKTKVSIDSSLDLNLFTPEGETGFLIVNFSSIDRSLFFHPSEVVWLPATRHLEYEVQVFSTHELGPEYEDTVCARTLEFELFSDQTPL